MACNKWGISDHCMRILYQQGKTEGGSRVFSDSGVKDIVFSQVA